VEEKRGKVRKWTDVPLHMIEELDEQGEATHVNTNETEEEVQGKCLAFDDDLKFDADNIEIKEGDHIFMAMVHLVDPQHFVCASSMVSRHLAKASTKNSVPKGFHKIISTAMKICSAKWLSTLSLNIKNRTMPLN
jgi:hypothetical protein